MEFLRIIFRDCSSHFLLYFQVPTLEYHNVTWTWLDLLLAVKVLGLTLLGLIGGIDFSLSCREELGRVWLLKHWNKSFSGKVSRTRIIIMKALRRKKQDCFLENSLELQEDPSDPAGNFFHLRNRKQLKELDRFNLVKYSDTHFIVFKYIIIYYTNALWFP